MYRFWGQSTHGNKGVNSAGLALKAGQFFYGIKIRFQRRIYAILASGEKDLITSEKKVLITSQKSIYPRR